MNKKVYLVILFALIIGFLLFKYGDVFWPSVEPEVAVEETVELTPQELIAITSPDISVDSLSPGDVISSPLVITGQARLWYFEGSFPIELYDSASTFIGSGVGTATSSWMTEAFVPFTATVGFSPQPSGSTGTLILHKANPSGEPAHDDSISIPVTF